MINRMGFNNARRGRGGAAADVTRGSARGIVGINVGANKDSPDRIADYAAMTRIMAPLASYLAVNISSPNTPGLRALQDEGALTGLLDAVLEARGEGGPPVFLKVAPDLEAGGHRRHRPHRDRQAARRADRLEHDHLAPAAQVPPCERAGGLSGEPLQPLALAAPARFPHGDRRRAAAGRRRRDRHRRGRLATHPRRGEPGPALQRDGLRRARASPAASSAGWKH